MSPPIKLLDDVINENAVACLRDLLSMAEAGQIVGIYGCVALAGKTITPIKAGWWDDATLALALHDLRHDFAELRQMARERADEDATT